MIRELREERGITQIELAERIGVSERTIRRYEQEEDIIQIGILKKILKALNANDVKDVFLAETDKHTHQEFPSSSLIKANSQNLHDFYTIPKLNIKASAGGGNEIIELESYESGEVICIDKAFFKTPQSIGNRINKMRIIQVDGYSMIPMLLPDSWVIFEEDSAWKGDGLYVLNYDNELMVKLLQKLPNGDIDIISANKDYRSYRIECDTQTIVCIIGKVLRAII
ncbi:helix-turn-helix domain-containing protein [Helicobacter jaachi]|uniref:Helix-turn-helix domain-containing protein n=1 Tax=Helicobacter jaachi TaxID=1677920 RepID=A0A4U8TCG1_9HELI|nr:LexA family transcriptional regulator [Helicobacter jaachi]TLD97656.1 helix-turn-helix domain-containing protein [Helicobacter jaachi]